VGQSEFASMEPPIMPPQYWVTMRSQSPGNALLCSPFLVTLTPVAFGQLMIVRE
jgi:hypothetical protein